MANGLLNNEPSAEVQLQRRDHLLYCFSCTYIFQSYHVCLLHNIPLNDKLVGPI